MDNATSGSRTSLSDKVSEATPRKRKAKPGVVVSGKESRAEEILHELFRTQGMDLRESPRTVSLVRDFVKLLGKEAK